MEMNITLNDFGSICRICIEEQEDLCSLTSFNIISMIKACSSVQIWLNDELPQQICTACLKRLQDSFNFKQLCEKSDDDLRQIISKYKKNNETQDVSENIDDTENIENTDDTDDTENNKPFKEEICVKDEIHSDEFTYEELTDELNYENNEKLKTENDGQEDEKEREKNFCDKCNTTFSKPMNLGRHMQLVHKAKGTKCSYCSRVCYHPIHLKSHEKLHTMFKCDICNKTFENKQKLGVHNYKHVTERPFHCQQCDRSFKNKWVLKKHVKTIHLGIQKYSSCHVCGKSIVAYHLQTHLQTHGKREILTCNLCSKKFIYEQSLKIHIKRAHENAARVYRQLCNICGRGVGSVAELTAHMLIHTNEKPYNCIKCDKKFRTKSTLNNHNSRAHLDVRKHICSVCSRGFYDKTILANHMRTHTGERPFKCQVCDKTFSFKSALGTHMKKVHTTQ